MKIFISYRRDDSGQIVGRICDYLERGFGRGPVFRDVDDIPPGKPFDDVLSQELDSCDVMLVIIGPSWLNIADKDGKRRLENPRDWVRIEVATALKRPNLRLIPVLIGNATMPEDSSLPPDLRALSTKQSVQLHDDPHFRDDIKRLIHKIKPPLIYHKRFYQLATVIVVVFLLAFSFNASLRDLLLAGISRIQQIAPSSTPKSTLESPTMTPTLDVSSMETQEIEVSSTVLGRLLWNDVPLQGADVRLSLTNGGFNISQTDENGEYALTVPPGDYNLFYRFPGSIDWIPGDATPFFSPVKHIELPFTVEEGLITELSAIHTFKQDDLKIISPTESIYPQIPGFEWEAYPSTDYYIVWLYEYSTPLGQTPYAYPIGRPVTTVGTSATFDTPLSTSKTYYLWVIAYNGNQHEIADGRSIYFRVGSKCTIVADRNGSMRSGPGSNYSIVQALFAGRSMDVIGQASGADGIIWWQLTNALWVSSDEVTQTGDCENLPVFEIPQ